MIDNLHFAKQIGVETMRSLEGGDIFRFGPLMHEHCLRKRGRSAGMSNDRVDQLYEIGLRDGGASEGKLAGAGGAGFLLFLTEDRKRLRRTMMSAGSTEMDFSFDFDGSVVHVRNRG
jgi:D-glycero-alpha-D-manno-heptose-7-phosphate kinase